MNLQNFSNETIDTLQLPQYQDAELTPVHPQYLKVVWFNIALVYGIIAIGAGVAFYFIEDIKPYWVYIMLGYALVLVTNIIVQVINFRNKGFAFREHDVIYRSGAISTTTTIIPYTRVQHVAEHEGIVSRMLGLSSIEIFTAGGAGSDIRIPGLEKVHAAAVKKLLVGKIEKDTQKKVEKDLYTAATEDINNENTPPDEV
ncbi:PH domain-containing protein [Flavobacterium sp. RHBU_3]|uniref:PH domain-containing protein n=1 Tax=Flavobacterium sp. RHBU_3 TaxID=3391184 RepID=UPI003984C46C